MVRFSAGEAEIVALLRFMTRRAKNGLRLVPLAAPVRDDLRVRHSTRPLVRRLTENDAPLLWGIRFADDNRGNDTASLEVKRLRDTGHYLVDAEKSRLIAFQLGPACGPERRREAVLEARDSDTPEHDESSAHAQAHALRDLVERCARRVRRRSSRYDNGRWYVPGEDPKA